MRLSEFAAIIEAETPYTLLEAHQEGAGYVATIGRDLTDGRRACIAVAMSGSDLEEAVSALTVLRGLVVEATGKLDLYLAEAA